MSTPAIPRDPKDWNIEILNGLLNIRDIEGDRFDFKGGDLGDMPAHICAMANADWGIIALGVDEKKNNDYLIGFEKKGYPSGKEDEIKRQLTDFIVQVDPSPKVTVENIKDTDGKFYPILKIEGEEKNKPYMLKNRGVIYVRINSSSMPASKITIFNLFSNVRERLKDVKALKSTCEATRSALILTSRIIGYGDTTSWTTIPPVDLTFLKNAALQAQWFLVEKNKFGVVDISSHRTGMQTYVHSLEKMNVNIETFNRAASPHDKQLILPSLREWKDTQSNVAATIGFLEDIISECDKFINEWNI